MSQSARLIRVVARERAASDGRKPFQPAFLQEPLWVTRRTIHFCPAQLMEKSTKFDVGKARAGCAMSGVGVEHAPTLKLS